MIDRKLILVTREGWFLLSDGEFTEISAWPKLNGPHLVVTDCDEAPVGVHRFEGKLAYAGALVEKHARTEGLTEGSTHIVLHRVAQVARGGVALFTAVPLDLWQHLQQWAAKQDDHCMLVVLVGLLDNGLSGGQARILHLGSTIHIAGLNEGGLFYAGVTVIGSGEDNLNTAVRALASRVRVDLARGVNKPIEWACVLGEKIESESRAAAVFADAAQCECRLAAHKQWPSRRDINVISALPGLCSSVGFHAIQATLPKRLAWASETLVAPLATVTLIVGLSLFGLGLLTHSNASQERQLALLRTQQAEALDARITAVSRLENTPAIGSVGEFARRLADGTTYDPVTMVQLIRRAAGQDIRIMRIKLESQGDKKKSFRIDGVAGGAGLASIGRFLSQTKAAGWTSEPLDPLMQSAGAFSYRLTPVFVSPV